MKHWSVDTIELEKDKRSYTIWRLEQAINFGLGEGKIKKGELKEYWNELVLDPQRKKFLSLLLA